jgi:hypothetical protein
MVGRGALIRAHNWREPLYRVPGEVSNFAIPHLQPGNRKAGGSRELPSAMFSPSVSFDGPIERPTTGVANAAIARKESFFMDG